MKKMVTIQMAKNYECYTEITKEILDSISVGDLIKVNNWKRPMRVRYVSDNYFVMTQTQFKDEIYSVCEKKIRTDGDHNNMTKGMYHTAPDASLFGWYGWLEYNKSGKYEFDSIETTQKYLQSFENGESELSERSGIAIKEIYIKRAN